MEEINVLNNKISIKKVNDEEYISLTDIARHKNSQEPKDVVKNWLRNHYTIEFLGLWEKINNNKFKGVEFDSFLQKAGRNYFVLSPKQWIKKTNAKGIISSSGRGGGTYAHKDIAIEFATWISVEFKLYLIKEFQRLKENEKEVEWDVKREFAKINYTIHTDAIKRNLIPPNITKEQQNKIYVNEADLLNVALFGMTANEWKDNNQNKKGNMRDYASAIQLICLANLESLNSVMIEEKIIPGERILKLNKTAIHQMKLLTKKRKEKTNKLI